MKEEFFDFEQLEIWKKSVDFCDRIITLVENLNSDAKHFRLVGQIEASSSSIALNIAEGKGRNSNKEFLQFLYYSRGSLYETITMLTIFHKRNWISESDFNELKNEAIILAKRINSFINYVKNRTQ